MPLVDISPLSPKQPCANNDHIDQAKTLKSSLTKKHVGITTKFSAKSWAKEFALLETAVGAHRVVPVLTWYCNNIRGQYVPLAFSAKSFRQKFDAIEQAMVRYQRDHPNIEISEEAKKIGETMKGWKWPKGGDYQTLLAAIQITMDTYRKFLTAVKKLSSQPTKEKVPGKKNRYRLIKGSQCVSVASPVFDRLDFADTFTRNWFRKLHETASHFGKEWNGSILKGAFTDFGHRKFQEYVEAILGSYTHDISIESFMRAVENAG